MTPRIPFPWKTAWRRIREDVDDEILGHIELKARELERAGLPREEAWARAEAAFGRTDTIRAECAAIQGQMHRRRGGTMTMAELRGDLRWTARSLVRAPGFTVFAVLTLGLGIAADTSVFSVASGLLSPRPGVRDAGTLVEAYRTPGFGSMSYPVFETLRDETPGLVGLAAFDPVGLSMDAGGGEPDVVMGFQVSGDYFDVLGTRPATGRFFQGAERDPEGRPAVAVLSYGLWRDRFAADPGVVGSTIRLNGEPVTVIGVAEEGFSGHVAAARAQIFVPLGARLPAFHGIESLRNAESSMLDVLGRVQPGTDLDALSTRMGQLAQARLEREGAQTTRYGVSVRRYAPVPGSLRGPAVTFFVILSVLVGLLLLITCLNVAGLLLSRSAHRRREIAIRLSLGAGRARLVRQLVVEALALSLVAGVVGVVLTYWITGALTTLQLPVTPIPGLRLDLHLRPDGTVLAYSLAVVVLAGLAFGLLPALRATRPDLVTDLKDGTASGAPGRSRVQGLLVGAQMAGTIILLTGSGLFLRALVSAETLDPGFDTPDVYVASFDLELAGRSDADSWAFYSELRRRVLDLPGVSHATVAGKLPLAGLSQMAPVSFEGVEPPAGSDGFTLANQSVGPDYFATLGIPLLRGRGILDSDDRTARRVVVVNELLADRMWPGMSPLGRTLTLPFGPVGTRDYEVVGVAATVSYNHLNDEPRLFAYFPAAQRPRTDMILHVKVAPGTPPPFREIRALASGLEPAAATLSTGSLTSAMALFLLPQRVGAWVTGVVGLYGLLLGVLGVYALTAYRVASNTREVGVRVALGATRAEVLTGVVRRGLLAPLVGGGVGLAGALLTTRFLQTFLFGVEPLDPVTFGAVIGALVLASVIANLAPAVRAARLDPARVLREE